MQTFHFEMLYGINLLRAFKFIQGRFLPCFFFTSRILLSNWSGNWYSTFFMAPLSSISIISWFINNSCVLDVVTCFGMFLCTGTFKNGITYPFTTDKISWSWVNFSQFLLKWANLPVNCRSGILLKGEHLLETLLESFSRQGSQFLIQNFAETLLLHLLFCFPPYCALCLSQLFEFLP